MTSSLVPATGRSHVAFGSTSAQALTAASASAPAGRPPERIGAGSERAISKKEAERKGRSPSERHRGLATSAQMAGDGESRQGPAPDPRYGELLDRTNSPTD